MKLAMRRGSASLGESAASSEVGDQCPLVLCGGDSLPRGGKDLGERQAAVVVRPILLDGREANVLP